MLIGFFAKGAQVANLVEVCLAMQIDIPTGLAFQIIFFNDIPSLISIFGGVIVISGIIAVVLEKYAMEKIRNSYNVRLRSSNQNNKLNNRRMTLPSKFEPEFTEDENTHRLNDLEEDESEDEENNRSRLTKEVSSWCTSKKVLNNKVLSYFYSGSGTRENTNCQKCLSYLSTHSGIFYGMMSGVCRAGVKIIKKDLTYRLTPGQILVLRSVFQGFIAVLVSPLLKQSLKSNKLEFPYLLGKCILQSISVWLCYISFGYISYYECIIGLYGTLAISSIFVSRCFLSEPVSCYKVCCACVTCLGIFTTFEPNLKLGHIGNWNTIFGYTLSILAGIVGSIGLSCNRRLKNTSPIAVAFYCAVSSFILGGIICSIQYRKGFHVELEDIWKTILLGVLSVMLIGFFAKGAQVANLVEVCLAMQIDMPTGLALQIIIFKNIPSLISIFGGFIVISGIIAVVLEQYVMEIIRNCISRYCHSNEDESNSLISTH
ncbi:hypothetical protein GQR58_013956 [Nymphon striatum]|nr:hypothetical protein GQR58_013956 [Nymphon striatum]